MELKQWLDAVPGRSVKLAAALKVYPSFISKIANGTKRVPLEQCVPIEQFTEQQVTCEEMRPDVDWAYLRNSNANQAQAQATPAPAATDLIAVIESKMTEFKDQLLHAAEDELHQVTTGAQVELKHAALDLRGEIGKDAHDAMERLAPPKTWDGIDRRDRADEAPAWDGTERRSQPDRRQPDVLEAPAGGGA
jgi:DNA-binding transcriptional regulator YdaS (Cro superfamily)